MNKESREWGERDARQSRLGSGDEVGMLNHESGKIGIRSEFGIPEVCLLLGSWLPD
jgi:hypothetical protein